MHWGGKAVYQLGSVEERGGRGGGRKLAYAALRTLSWEGLLAVECHRASSFSTPASHLYLPCPLLLPLPRSPLSPLWLPQAPAMPTPPAGTAASWLLGNCFPAWPPWGLCMEALPRGRPQPRTVSGPQTLSLSIPTQAQPDPWPGRGELPVPWAFWPPLPHPPPFLFSFSLTC